MIIGKLLMEKNIGIVDEKMTTFLINKDSCNFNKLYKRAPHKCSICKKPGHTRTRCESKSSG